MEREIQRKHRLYNDIEPSIKAISDFAEWLTKNKMDSWFNKSITISTDVADNLAKCINSVNCTIKPCSDENLVKLVDCMNELKSVTQTKEGNELMTKSRDLLDNITQCVNVYYKTLSDISMSYDAQFALEKLDMIVSDIIDARDELEGGSELEEFDGDLYDCIDLLTEHFYTPSIHFANLRDKVLKIDYTLSNHCDTLYNLAKGMEHFYNVITSFDYQNRASYKIMMLNLLNGCQELIETIEEVIRNDANMNK